MLPWGSRPDRYIFHSFRRHWRGMLYSLPFSSTFRDIRDQVAFREPQIIPTLPPFRECNLETLRDITTKNSKREIRDRPPCLSVFVCLSFLWILCRYDLYVYRLPALMDIILSDSLPFSFISIYYCWQIKYLIWSPNINFFSQIRSAVSEQMHP